MASIKSMSDDEMKRIAKRARAAINDVLIDEGIPEDERNTFWKVWKQ